MLLVGLDAASRLEKFGFAIGAPAEGQVGPVEAGTLVTKGEPADALQRIIIPKLRDAGRALVAIDAPLGWPAPFCESLASHWAGERIKAEKSAVFSRATDRYVKQRIGKNPLEVAADKIARAAHTALEVLAQLREGTGRPIPLAWSADFQGCAVIEVYPAATLMARGLRSSGYKKADALAKSVRRDIAQALRGELPALHGLVDASPDEFDAALCLLAAKDFLEAKALPPEDVALARREGWIWVRAPGS
jgi:predicted nuclease with RNAse H fold